MVKKGLMIRVGHNHLMGRRATPRWPAHYRHTPGTPAIYYYYRCALAVAEAWHASHTTTLQQLAGGPCLNESRTANHAQQPACKNSHSYAPPTTRKKYSLRF
jgi:hypothetical protein